MTDFSDLLKFTNPPIYWTVILGGTRRSDGAQVEFNCTKGHNHREEIGGKIVQFRDVWLKGSPIKWTKAITRAERDANRSFFASGYAGGGERTWRFRPDARMRRELASIDLDGKFHLKGWGPTKADGSPFPLADADTPVRGIITRTKVVDDAVIELTYIQESFDFDQPVQMDRFGGYDNGFLIIAPPSGGDPVGTWIASGVSTAFDVDASAPGFQGFTVEMIGIADDIPAPQIDAQAILAVSGPPAAPSSWSWGLTMESGAILTFRAKTEQFATSFTMPQRRWFSIHLSVEPDGKTFEVSAGVGRAPDSISVVASGVLVAALSPAGGTAGLTIGNPGPVFAGSGAAWQMLVVEFRTHDRTLDLAERNARRALTWIATEPVRPSHLYRMADASTTVLFDEDGGVDLMGLANITGAQKDPSGDGPLPDSGDDDTAGRTIPQIWGRVVNRRARDVSRGFDGKFVSDILAEVHEARSSQAPYTLDVVIEAEFFLDTVAETLMITALGGQEDINFFRLLEPDGDPALGATLPGQIFEGIGVGSPVIDGEYEIEFISDDGKTLKAVDPGFAGMNRTAAGTVRTPVSGDNKFAGQVRLGRGIVVVDRGQLVDLGLSTFDASGHQGDALDKEESMAGLFQALLRDSRDFSGTINEDPSLLDISPAGIELELGGSKDFRTVANELLVPNWWRYDPEDDSFTLGGFLLPGTPTAEIGESDLKIVEEILRQRPWRNVEILYAANGTVQDPSSAVSSAVGTVPAKNRSQWGSEGQTVTRNNPSPGKSALNQDDPIVTSAYDRAGANLILERVTALVFEELEWNSIPCATMSSYDVEPGDTVRFTWLGLTKLWQAGQDVRIASWQKSTDMTIEYETYGLAESQTLTENGDPITDSAGEFIHDNGS